MKKLFLSSIFALLFVNFCAAEVNRSTTAVSEFSQSEEVLALSPELTQIALDRFLTMTPKEYKKMTGKKLGLKKTLKLKLAQRAVKKQLKKGAELRPEAGDGITKGIYILLAILGLAWIAMEVKDDWSGSDWIVNLLLTFLCWLPGLIHALVKMKKYYS